jgi:hypothetical protein
VNLVFLASAGVLISLCVHFPSSTGSEPGAGALNARRVCRADTSLIDAEARRIAGDMIARNTVSSGVSVTALEESVRQKLLAPMSTVTAGSGRTWRFHIDEASFLSGDEAVIRAVFYSSSRDRVPLPASWRIENEAGKCVWRHRAEIYPDGLYTVSFPASLLSAGHFSVVFENHASPDGNSTFLIRPDRQLQVFLPESGFYSNLIRVLAAAFAVLALVSALGIAAGSIFSFPVAVFAACALFFYAAVSQYFAFTLSPEGRQAHHHHHDHHTEDQRRGEKGLLLKVSEKCVVASAGAVKPLFRAVPVRDLSDGIFVSWRFVGGVFVLSVGCYSMLFLLAGTFCLSRRELAGVR